MVDNIKIERLPVIGAVVEVYVMESHNTLEILREAAKKLQREVLRYEAGLDRDINR